MVYSKGRILLQSAEEGEKKKKNKRKKTKHTPIPSSPSQESQKRLTSGERSCGGEGAAGGPPRRPEPSGSVGPNDSEDGREQRETNGAGAVLPQAGRCARGEAERGELVFLQVPGFKKLQAFLHGQAFLQALGETKDKTAWDGAGGSGDPGAGRGGRGQQRAGGWPSQRD